MHAYIIYNCMFGDFAYTHISFSKLLRNILSKSWRYVHIVNSRTVEADYIANIHINLCEQRTILINLRGVFCACVFWTNCLYLSAGGMYRLSFVLQIYFTSVVYDHYVCNFLYPAAEIPICFLRRCCVWERILFNVFIKSSLNN